jgi:hypothetical protein
MRYIKILGLAVVAAAALMAFVGAGTASAKEGVLCSTTTNPCNSKWTTDTVFDFSLTTGKSAELVNAAEPKEVLDTCTISTIKSSLTKNPDTSTGTATSVNTEIKWEKCTWPTTTLVPGALKVERIAGTSNGTVRADAEIRVTINTVFFGSCVYGVKAGAHLGEITEGTAATPAEFHANKALAEKLEGSNIACPEKSLWTADYALTTPTNTTLSVSSS